MYSKLDLQ